MSRAPNQDDEPFLPPKNVNFDRLKARYNDRKEGMTDGRSTGSAYSAASAADYKMGPSVGFDDDPQYNSNQNRLPSGSIRSTASNASYADRTGLQARAARAMSAGGSSHTVASNTSWGSDQVKDSGSMRTVASNASDASMASTRTVDSNASYGSAGGASSRTVQSNASMSSGTSGASSRTVQSNASMSTNASGASFRTVQSNVSYGSTAGDEGRSVGGNSLRTVNSNVSFGTAGSMRSAASDVSNASLDENYDYEQLDADGKPIPSGSFRSVASAATVGPDGKPIQSGSFRSVASAATIGPDGKPIQSGSFRSVASAASTTSDGKPVKTGSFRSVASAASTTSDGKPVKTGSFRSVASATSTTAQSGGGGSRRSVRSADSLQFEDEAAGVGGDVHRGSVSMASDTSVASFASGGSQRSVATIASNASYASATTSRTTQSNASMASGASTRTTGSNASMGSGVSGASRHSMATVSSVASMASDDDGGGDGGGSMRTIASAASFGDNSRRSSSGAGVSSRTTQRNASDTSGRSGVSSASSRTLNSNASFGSGDMGNSARSGASSRTLDSNATYASAASKGSMRSVASDASVASFKPSDGSARVVVPVGQGEQRRSSSGRGRRRSGSKEGSSYRSLSSISKDSNSSDDSSIGNEMSTRYKKAGSGSGRGRGSSAGASKDGGATSSDEEGDESLRGEVETQPPPTGFQPPAVVRVGGRCEMQGTLALHTGWMSGWKKRYYVLTGNLLVSFKTMNDVKPQGMILLDKCRMTFAAKSKRKHSFEVNHPKNPQLLLSADSEDLAKAWMAALTAASEIPAKPDFGGELVKCGGSHKSWKKRHFVLYKDMLYYFKPDNPHEIIGFIPVAGCTIDGADHVTKRKYTLSIYHAKRRTFYLEAPTQDALTNWRRVLTAAAHPATL